MNPENKNRLEWKLGRLKNARPIEKLKALEDQISNTLSLVGMYSDKNKDDYYKLSLIGSLSKYLVYMYMEKDRKVRKDLLQKCLNAIYGKEIDVDNFKLDDLQKEMNRLAALHRLNKK